MVLTFLKEKPINQDKFVVVLMLLSNVAMKVLIKYYTNSFPKLTNSFNRKLINCLQNCSTSLLFVCDWSILAEVKSNWLTG